MMSKKSFDSGKNDAQATKVEPVKVSGFCFEAYQEYAQGLTERCEKFVQASSGVLVYRRMRVAEVFSFGCRDMKQSLEWQLGALQKSMDYEADVPNFLEPWYGIGVIGTAFGLDYIWNPGQAPAVKPAFQTIDEALAYNFKPVKDTEVGKHSLQMIEYFLEQTRGKIPMSMGDIQSPFNNATNVVDTSNFLISMIMEPEKVLKFLDLIADLEIDFYKEQEKLIGDVLVRPGHGFASSFVFEGFGMSDDNVVMVDEESYLDLISPSFTKLGNAFGGAVFHSCGNYSDKTGMFTKMQGLKMVDAAFTAETDPSPNPAEPFAEALSGTGIVLNARMVGDPEVVKETTSRLWKPGMKLLAVTFSPTPEEQQQAYRIIHSICQ
ncbi:MAG: uroporphyrinogen decarboxylase family protein [Mangrovibacterium sp.]